MTDIPLTVPAAPPPDSGLAPADQIFVAFAGSARQRRWTVLIRAILAIPHYVLVLLAGIAVFVVCVIGWFAALAMGRLPGWAAGFLTGWLRWSTRMHAYLWLLTDRYPPFSAHDADYPVRLAVAPGRLSRAAVFFRLLLVIPAVLVLGITLEGAGGIVLFVTWLIVSISGRMPDALHAAMAAVVRFSARYTGYLLLLTGTYPWWGLFGDRPDGAAQLAGPPVTAPAAGMVPAEPGWGGPPAASVVPAELGWGGAPVTAPAAGVVPAGPGWVAPPAASPGAWRLVLSGGARKLVVMFLAVGALSYLGTGIYDAVAVSTGVKRADAVNTISRAHTALNSTLNAAQGQVSACGQKLACVTRQEARVGQAFGTFGSVLASTAMPDAASTAAEASLARDTSRIAAVFRQLSAATSVSQYQNIVISSGLQHTLLQFDADFRQLGVTLGAVRG